MSHPLYGLLLVGGRSKRMGRDKALLSYDGTHTQLARTASLLGAVCEKTFVSVRQDQDLELPARTEAICDSIEDINGPLCGILSAMAAHPESDWLVVACDMPHLASKTLEQLVVHYQKHPGELTAYQSTHDHLPEPLCAIYPAGKGTELLALSKELHTSSPRKLLIKQGARLMEQADPRSLDNINTPEEFDAILRNR